MRLLLCLMDPNGIDLFGRFVRYTAKARKSLFFKTRNSIRKTYKFVVIFIYIIIQILFSSRTFRAHHFRLSKSL